MKIFSKVQHEDYLIFIPVESRSESIGKMLECFSRPATRTTYCIGADTYIGFPFEIDFGMKFFGCLYAKAGIRNTISEDLEFFNLSEALVPMEPFLKLPFEKETKSNVMRVSEGFSQRMFAIWGDHSIRTREQALNQILKVGKENYPEWGGEIDIEIIFEDWQAMEGAWYPLKDDRDEYREMIKSLSSEGSKTNLNDLRVRSDVYWKAGAK
jgi:hypothetical protein